MSTIKIGDLFDVYNLETKTDIKYVVTDVDIQYSIRPVNGGTEMTIFQTSNGIYLSRYAEGKYKITKCSRLPYEIEFTIGTHIHIGDLPNFAKNFPRICSKDIFWKGRIEIWFPKAVPYKPKNVLWEDYHFLLTQDEFNLTKFIIDTKNLSLVQQAIKQEHITPEDIKSISSDNHRYRLKLIMFRNWEIIEWMLANRITVHDNDAHWVPSVIKNHIICACGVGRMEYLMKDGWTLDEKTVGTAAIFGDVKIGKFLLQHGYIFGDYELNSAINKGHFNFAKWLIEEQNIEILEDACNEAVEGDSLELVKYFWGRGYKPDIFSITSVVANGNWEMLEWLEDRANPNMEYFDYQLMGHHLDTALEYNQTIFLRVIHQMFPEQKVTGYAICNAYEKGYYLILKLAMEMDIIDINKIRTYRPDCEELMDKVHNFIHKYM